MKWEPALRDDSLGEGFTSGAKPPDQELGSRVATSLQRRCSQWNFSSWFCFSPCLVAVQVGV